MQNLDDKRDKNLSDHDLLLRLDERFDSFQQSVNMMFNEMMRKHDEVLNALKDKVGLSAMIEVHDILEKVDKRLTTLETWRWWLTGAFAVAGVIGGIVGNYIIKLI